MRGDGEEVGGGGGEEVGEVGRGGCTTLPPQGFDPLTNQIVSLLVLFYNINFRQTIQKIFIKAYASTYANFEEARVPIKRIFLN